MIGISSVTEAICWVVICFSVGVMLGVFFSNLPSRKTKDDTDEPKQDDDEQ
jgi:uncharacterized protein YneF (UPF0154 family)